MSLKSPAESPCARNVTSRTEKPSAAQIEARPRHCERLAPLPWSISTEGAWSSEPGTSQAPTSTPSRARSRTDSKRPQDASGIGSGNGGRSRRVSRWATAREANNQDATSKAAKASPIASPLRERRREIIGRAHPFDAAQREGALEGSPPPGQLS